MAAMVVRHYHIPVSDVKKLEKLAAKKGKTKAELVREAIKAYIKKQK